MPNFNKSKGFKMDKAKGKFDFGGGSKVKDWKGDATKKGERESFLRRSAGKNRFGKNLG